MPHRPSPVADQPRPQQFGAPPPLDVAGRRWSDPTLQAEREVHRAAMDAWWATPGAELYHQALTAHFERERQKRERSRVVRKPPKPRYADYPPGVCRLCGAPCPGRRTLWCSDDCGNLVAASVNPSRAYAHLTALHGHCCWQCGSGEPFVALEVDHVRPLWSLTPRERCQLRWWLPFNLQLLCRPCHKAKTAREAARRANLARQAG